MNKIISHFITIISIFTVFFHISIGHFFAPNGITFLPITMILMTFLIFQLTGYKIYVKCFITVLLFLTLEIGIKFFAGGHHDNEGQIWINSFYLFGLIPSTIIIFYKIFKNTEIILKIKILIVCLFLVFQYLQSILFGSLGLGIYYPIN
jgi:hypothetical protein